MKYRNKPVVIEAVQWKGNNLDEIKKNLNETENFLDCETEPESKKLLIATFCDLGTVNLNDYIIKYKGDFCRCSPDVFKQKYEKLLPIASISNIKFNELLEKINIYIDEIELNDYSDQFGDDLKNDKSLTKMKILINNELSKPITKSNCSIADLNLKLEQNMQAKEGLKTISKEFKQKYDKIQEYSKSNDENIEYIKNLINYKTNN